MRQPIGKAVTVLVLLALPLLAAAFGYGYLLSLATRIVLFAAVAASLNLIMGYGAMPSMGHAAFFGAGAYVVAIMARLAEQQQLPWLDDGLLQLAVGVPILALLALVIGAICLRTSGIYFLMTSLAMGQIVYVVAAATYQFGGDDGLTLAARSRLPGLNLDDQLVRYGVAACFLAAVLFLLDRVVGSRFGLVLRATRMNARRVAATGTDPRRIALTAFVLAGVIAGLAGMLMVNQMAFVSPAMLNWTYSGDLMVAVALGGLGTTLGPVFGSLVLMLLEEVLSSRFDDWQLLFGLVIVGFARFCPGGLTGLGSRLWPTAPGAVTQVPP